MTVAIRQHSIGMKRVEKSLPLLTLVKALMVRVFQKPRILVLMSLRVPLLSMSRALNALRVSLYRPSALMETWLLALLRN